MFAYLTSSEMDSMTQKSHVLIVAAAVLACTASLLAQSAATQSAAKAKYGTWGVDLTARDASVRPGDDFWRYANNSWLRTNPIPADRADWGVFPILREDVERQLRTIVDEAGARAATDPVARQVADLYASWMDEAGIEARGAAPLRPYLSTIAAAQTSDDLIRLFAAPGYPGSDRRRHHCRSGATRHATLPASTQGGLGMPNRDYYLREGEQFDRYRAAYRDFIVTRASPGRHSRRRSQGRRHHRPRAADRGSALDARTQPRRHPVNQPDDAEPSSLSWRRSSTGLCCCRSRGSAA